MKFREIFIISSVIIVGLVIAVGSFWPSAWWSMILFGPLILIGYTDFLQRKHSVRRNFPLIGNIRYLLEAIRPEIMQYFVETDTEGRPINRLRRSLIYQRAKNVNDTTPFGTQKDVYKTGYEWMTHSIYAKKANHEDEHKRVIIGGKDCKKPYAASLLNISAMSFGALSKNAIMALNKGAKMGGFAQNTGEGGISSYHQEYGGDLIWQIGTGYFGCRNEDGTFCEEKFKEKAHLEQVKMIEIKISQGAKPGHGGILPASKNTSEIAHIRGVKPATDVLSPPAHSAFLNPEELLQYIQKLRELSGGKPIGFKLCIGKKEEFVAICQTMVSTNIKPDFITIDGGEGGTGAAPVEFSNTLGMPLRDGLSFAYDTLCGFDLKKDIKLMASGKIISGFDIARAMALGADLCYSARAMMMSLGCIQALRCNNNTCPVGVATQDPSLIRGLNVEEKSKRVASYHDQTLHSFIELIAASGIDTPSEIRRSHIYRRVTMEKVKKYDELFPYVENGSLIQNNVVLEKYSPGIN
ncbi:FMN-binding glutamate synthase family protein [Xanthovirga aplysinae]|uniref:FMN-binding glutamate synthase family protein n=1 Tax=Xanthovirga aplysinae TaxID=2529853 RepID=UPI0012BBAC47|nr:FMN-binding glutamate synthase family protein [Xanthovirga aplysinae]MTI31803.1 FMN-binding glutamate synthase family protein [Xanthovirga aplysinae]